MATNLVRRGKSSMKSKVVRYFLTHKGHTRKQTRPSRAPGAPDPAQKHSFATSYSTDGERLPNHGTRVLREREMLPSLRQHVESQAAYYADILRRAQAARRELFQH